VGEKGAAGAACAERTDEAITETAAERGGDLERVLGGRNRGGGGELDGAFRGHGREGGGGYLWGDAADAGAIGEVQSADRGQRVEGIEHGGKGFLIPEINRSTKSTHSQTARFLTENDMFSLPLWMGSQ
jgi:hypothetical protein